MTCGRASLSASVWDMKLILESYWGLPSSTFIHLYVTNICTVLVMPRYYSKYMIFNSF